MNLNFVLISLLSLSIAHYTYSFLSIKIERFFSHQQRLAVLSSSNILNQAAKARSIKKDEILAELEKYERQPQTVDKSKIDGVQWEVLFSSKLPNGYMPITEMMTFDLSRNEAKLKSDFKGFSLGGSEGSCDWIERNMLKICFDLVKIGPFSFKKLGPKEKSTVIYTFFYLNNGIAGFRSSSGNAGILKQFNE
mmetsp:Transcript_20801/g.30809  ORF Transcript_20801/g.30809 Transcript_20801/m.30809 type:complete len:193 (+) Transcript_20801:48-626(+)